MPTFATPEPILVAVDLAVGDVRLTASDRTDTIVTVTPTDPASNVSVEATQRVRVDHSDRTLDIRQSLPSSYNHRAGLPSGFVTITVELPTDSRLHGAITLGTVSGSGRLGECDLSVDYGDLRLDEVADALRFTGSSGNVLVQRACSDVDVRTSTGNIRIAEVVCGEITLTTAVGAIEVGVRNGSAVHLDVRTKLGRVRNLLEVVDEPGDVVDTVRIRARTNLDDIVITWS